MVASSAVLRDMTSNLHGYMPPGGRKERVEAQLDAKYRRALNSEPPLTKVVLVQRARQREIGKLE